MFLIEQYDSKNQHILEEEFVVFQNYLKEVESLVCEVSRIADFLKQVSCCEERFAIMI